MSGFALECPYPNATTCVIVGPIPPAGWQRVAAFASALWFTPGPREATPAPAGVTIECVGLQEDLRTCVAALERFLAKDGRRLPTLLVGPGGNTERVMSQVRATLDAHHRARFTRQRDGFRWQDHVLQNLPAYLERRVPEAWAGALAGLPAFVCGAGPSFEVTAPVVAKWAEAAVVFAGDSAVRALARHGVAPEFVVSTDVAKTPEKCLTATLPPGSRVILSSLSPPAWWQEAAPQHCRFLSGRQVTEDWLSGQGLAKTTARVVENCGATALELARFLGCAPIYLAGMDLALDENGELRRHHSDTPVAAYAESGFKADQVHPRVPGNTSATVPTHVWGDWHAMDQRLAEWPPGLVVNVNDRGARLQNTTVVAPQDLALSAPRRDKASALAALAEPPAPSAVPAITGRARRAAELGRTCVGQARHALAAAGPAGAAQALRRALMDPDCARLLGAQAFKVMPHLVPPIEGDDAFWQTLLEECECLLRRVDAAFPQ